MDYGQKLLFDHLYKVSHGRAGKPNEIMLAVDTLHNRDYIIVEGHAALRIHDDCCFDWNKVRTALHQSKAFTGIAAMFDNDFTPGKLIGSKYNDRWKELFVYETEDGARVYLSKELNGILEKYCNSFGPITLQVLLNEKSCMVAIMINDEYYGIILGVRLNT